MNKNIRFLLIIPFIVPAFLVLALQAAPKTIDLGYKVIEKSKVQKTIAFDTTKDRILEIDNVFGGITVTGSDSDKIQLNAVKTIRSENKAKQVLAKKEVTLDITSKNGKVTVYVNGPFRLCSKGPYKGMGRSNCYKKTGYIVEYDFQLQVPRHVALTLKTSTNGAIIVSDIVGRCAINHANGEISVNKLTGALNIKTANGKILLDAINGSGDAHTSNGRVDVTFVRNPKTDCSFHTVNGKVSVKFQPGLGADFKVKTTMGKILSDFPFDYQKSGKSQVTGKRVNGKFIYKSAGFQAIRIGKGGPSIKMDTLTGNIVIANGG
ncbi:MAG: DUF4097 domain-containing protein [bacterium]|nr:DUF4097 domain-containing protein [bacterium]